MAAALGGIGAFRRVEGQTRTAPPDRENQASTARAPPDRREVLITDLRGSARAALWSEITGIAIAPGRVEERAQALLEPLCRVVSAAAWIAVRDPDSRRLAAARPPARRPRRALRPAAPVAGPALVRGPGPPRDVQALTLGADRGQGARGDRQLHQDVLDVRGDGPLSDDQRPGGLPVGASLDEQTQHL
jgi:hypothetical protein